MGHRAVIYARISRDKTGAGLGVDRQTADCRALADRLGWEVASVRTDNDLSAYSGKPRPGYRALLADLEAGRADAVLVWHTDRLHRSPVELEGYIGVCEPRGVPTQTVKAGLLDLATANGRMTARIHGAVARQEVEHMIERQKRARVQSAAAGTWAGGSRPYGYAADGRTVIEVEAAEIRRAADAVIAGVSLRSITKDMNARGLATSTGRPWRQDRVREVLLRPRNAGLMQHLVCAVRPKPGEQRHQHCAAWLCTERATDHVHCVRIAGPADWPAIVPEESWRAVVAVLSDPERRTNPGGPRRWLLSGLASCGVCGAPVMSTTAGGSRGRGAGPNYACSARKCVIRNAAEVDAFVSAVIAERLARPDVADLLARDAGPDVAGLRARKVMLRQRLDSLGEAFGAGDIDARQLTAGSREPRAALIEVDRQLGEASRGSVLAGIADAPKPAAAWRALEDLDRRRAVVGELVEVTILPATRKGRPAGWKAGESYFDPTTVRVEPKRR